MSEVFEMYDVRLDYIGRGRGAMLLQTDKGVRQIRATTAVEKRLQAEYDFKEHMYLAGFPHIDRLVKNVEDELITYDRYGNPFVMRMFFDGREMGVSNKNEIMLAVDNDVKRRNREMKRVHNYIAKQSPKREFESLFMQAFPYFYEQGLNCEQAEAGTAGESEHMGYCHGTYNHHSVLVCGTADARYIATINFEKYHIGNQLQDLYYFIRKTVEKNGYAFALLTAILERYQQGIPLQQMDVAYICGLYRYPEKFYKLSNQYMNGSKTRISPKMVEKLNRIMEEEEKKQTLLEKLSSYNISKK